MRLDSRPRQRERVLAQRALDSVVLLSLQDGQYYTLEGVGGRVWELCDGTRSVAEVIATLCQEFDAPPAEIESDVLDLLTELAGERLVVEDP